MSRVFNSYKNWLKENKEEDDDGIIVLLPGGFKMMTGGHLDLIQKYASSPEVKEVRVLVGHKPRNGIDQDTAMKIARALTKNIDKVKVKASDPTWYSPILAAYKTVEEATKGTYALGASSKGDDYKRVRSFTDQHQPGGKYHSVLHDKVKVEELIMDADPLTFKTRSDDLNYQPISASTLRNDVMNNDFLNFAAGYPNTPEKQIKTAWKALEDIVTPDIPKVKKPRKVKIQESYLFEGGNAIETSRPLSKEELIATYEDVQGVALELLGIQPEALKPIGSYGKKKPGDTYGDIDVALDAKALNTEGKSPIDYVYDVFNQEGFETVKMKGFNQVTIGFPIANTNDMCQVDFMLTDSMAWSNFAYAAPDMSKDESKYKGSYSGNLLMAIISEAFKEVTEEDEDGNIISYTFMAFRLNSGVFEVSKSKMGKKGLIKTPKIISQKFITNDPLDVLHMAIGEDYDDLSLAGNFEKLWDIVVSPDFIHSENVLKIVDKFAFYLRTQKFPYPKECVDSYPEIFRINESLNEMAAAKLNTHMRHAEELIFEGPEGLDFIKYIFDNLYAKMTNSPSDSTLSVKIDGAPAMMLWSRFPGLRDFGVGTKTVFNKKPKTCHSEEEVEELYGDRPDLADKLKTLLKYAQEINIPEGEIWQGDFLFDQALLKKESENITFKPNTIKYSIPLDTELGDKVDSSEFGIAWHTRYLGEIGNLQTVFNIDLSEINDPDDIYMSEPYIRQISKDKLEGMADKDSEIKKDLDLIYEDIDKLNTPEYESLLSYKSFAAMFAPYYNQLIREKKSLSESTFIDDFLKFLASKNKSENIIKKMETFVNEHKTSIMLMIKLTNDISDLKRKFLSKLNTLETYKAYVDLKQGGEQSINQEGFAISSPDGNVVKIVDREEFFYLNSSPDIIKGWEH